MEDSTEASLLVLMQVSEPKEHLSVPSATSARQPPGRIGNAGNFPCCSLNVMCDLECHGGRLALTASQTNSSPLWRYSYEHRTWQMWGPEADGALSAPDRRFWWIAFVYCGHPANWILRHPICSNTNSFLLFVIHEEQICWRIPGRLDWKWRPIGISIHAGVVQLFWERVASCCCSCRVHFKCLTGRQEATACSIISSLGHHPETSQQSSDEAVELIWFRMNAVNTENEGFNRLEWLNFTHSFGTPDAPSAWMHNNRFPNKRAVGEVGLLLAEHKNNLSFAGLDVRSWF